MNPVFVDTSVLIAAEDTAGGALYQACLDWLDLLWRTRTGRTDALFVVIRSYATPAATLTMAVPYRNAESSDGFAVHRPKFLDWQGKSDPDYQALGAAFFRGVDAHDEASVVWAEHSDDSI